MKARYLILVSLLAALLTACASAPTPTVEPTPAQEPTEEPAPEPTAVPEDTTIVGVATDAGDFTTLLAAAQAAGLVETLQGEGPYTVFAPNDEAFQKVLDGMGITVEDILSDTEALSDILLYHVVEGAVPAADVVGLESAATVQGEEISIRVDGDNVYLNQTVQVIATDIEASNGIIHVIDSVLFPLSYAWGGPWQPIGTFDTGAGEGAGEITAFDSSTATLIVLRADLPGVDVVDLSDPTAPDLKTTVDLAEFGPNPNSIAARDGIAAVAIQAEEAGQPGVVVFMDMEGTVLSSVEVGNHPDMVTFTPDGGKVLTAGEGEPNFDYTVDPEGNISIIDISGGVEGVTAANVQIIGFTDFNEGGARADEVPADLRVYGPNASVAQDIEPEYIAITPDSATAYVTLQENNALAVIDIESATVSALVALGLKDHSAEGNGLDGSNEDGGINIATYPVLGMFLPDAIYAFETGGEGYLITANEGDARDYVNPDNEDETFFSEETRIEDVTLDPEVFEDPDAILSAIGRLKITTTLGNEDDDEEYEALYSFGARSFTIWDLEGNFVSDSGDALERFSAILAPDLFNIDSGLASEFDSRSDDKGPEPEAVVVGEVDGTVLAFVGMERLGGIMIFDVTDPTAPSFIQWANNANPYDEEAPGDVSPEGLLFVSAEESPTGAPLLIVSNELSGTVTIYSIVE